MEHIYNQEQFGENWFTYPTVYDSVVQLFPSGSKFVEVGRWKGKSSAYMAVEIANSEKNIDFYCVDHWEGGPDHKDWDVLSELYTIWKTNMQPLEDYFIEMKMTSVEASTKFEDESLDFVFIDASHAYEDVKLDIETWMPKVKLGGIIGGHDYEDYFPSVKQAVNECLEGKEFDVYEKCWLHKKL